MAHKHKKNRELYRQKINKFKKQFKDIYIKFIYIFCIFGIIISITYFLIGYHNLDLGQNMRYLECYFGTQMVDRMSDGNYYTSGEVYSIGIRQLFIGFFLGLWSAFMFGYYHHNFIIKGVIQ